MWETWQVSLMTLFVKCHRENTNFVMNCYWDNGDHGVGDDGVHIDDNGDYGVGDDGVRIDDNGNDGVGDDGDGWVGNDDVGNVGVGDDGVRIDDNGNDGVGDDGNDWVGMILIMINLNCLASSCLGLPLMWY